MLPSGLEASTARAVPQALLLPWTICKKIYLRKIAENHSRHPGSRSMPSARKGRGKRKHLWELGPRAFTMVNWIYGLSIAGWRVAYMYRSFLVLTSSASPLQEEKGNIGIFPFSRTILCNWAMIYGLFHIRTRPGGVEVRPLCDLAVSTSPFGANCNIE